MQIPSPMQRNKPYRCRWLDRSRSARSSPRMSNETFASERSGSGLRWRNVATVAALFALLSVMALTTPLAEQWVRDQRARQAAAPNPVIPDAQEASAIAFLVLEGLHFDGVPPPPPAPGESGESLNRRPLRSSLNPSVSAALHKARDRIR